MQPYEEQYCAMLELPTKLGTHATQRFGYLFSRVSSLTDEYYQQ